MARQITNAEIAVLRKMFHKRREQTDPLVLSQSVPGAHQKAAEIIAAQNVLRDCITVIMNESMPIDEAFIVEMALRLASYTLSIAEIEKQKMLTEAFVAAFPEFHNGRLKKRIGIPSTWLSPDGVEHPNMPTKENTN